MNCKICLSTVNLFASARILKKYKVSYFRCNTCGFVSTEEPYWLGEAYRQTINLSDTGIMLRNIALARKTAVLLFFLFEKNAKFLDFAGGYGILTRLMRDIGFDFYWYDKYTQNLFAKGFEYSERFENIELITSFESFEHFLNPIEEIEKMVNISKNILFSTEVLPNPIPDPNEWWYYGLEHGQHISFYSLKTLSYIAIKNGLALYSNGSLHLLTAKRISGLYFKLLLKFSKVGFLHFVQRSMRSRTFDDMKQIVSALSKEVGNENTF